MSTSPVPKCWNRSWYKFSEGLTEWLNHQDSCWGCTSSGWLIETSLAPFIPGHQPAVLIYKPSLMKCLCCDMAQGFAGGRAWRTHPELNDRSESRRLSADPHYGVSGDQYWTAVRVQQANVTGRGWWTNRRRKWQRKAEHGGCVEERDKKVKWKDETAPERVWLSETRRGVWKNTQRCYWCVVERRKCVVWCRDLRELTVVDSCLNDRQKNNPQCCEWRVVTVL